MANFTAYTPYPTISIVIGKFASRHTNLGFSTNTGTAAVTIPITGQIYPRTINI